MVAQMIDNNMEFELFVDLDGVLADYEGEYRRLTGGDPSEKGKQKAQRFKAHPHFYRHLPLLSDAMKLWNYVKQFNPSILSAASNYVPASRQDKYDWVAEHLGLRGPKVIVVDYPNHKQKYCKGKHSVLIDDNTKNCSEWINAGGTAIIHKSAESTIHKLKELMAPTHHVHEAFVTLAVPTENVAEAFDELIDRT